MTTRWFSYALKAKLPGSLCLIIIGTEGTAWALSLLRIVRRWLPGRALVAVMDGEFASLALVRHPRLVLPALGDGGDL